MAEATIKEETRGQGRMLASLLRIKIMMLPKNLSNEGGGICHQWCRRKDKYAHKMIKDEMASNG